MSGRNRHRTQVFVNLIVGQKFDGNRSDYFELIDLIKSSDLFFYGWLGWFSFLDSVIKKNLFFTRKFIMKVLILRFSLTIF